MLCLNLKGFPPSHVFIVMFAKISHYLWKDCAENNTVTIPDCRYSVAVPELTQYPEFLVVVALLKTTQMLVLLSGGLSGVSQLMHGSISRIFLNSGIDFLTEFKQSTLLEGSYLNEQKVQM